MKKIYITGDRSIDPLTSVSLVNIVLTKIAHEQQVVHYEERGVRFVTGNSKTGIERGARYLLPEAATDVVHYDTNADGKPEFDEIHRILAPEVDEVWFIHPDPLSSRIGKSLHQHFPIEKIKMPLQEIA